MLTKLSDQERSVIALCDERARNGILDDTELFVDSFSMSIFGNLEDGAEVLDVGCGMGRAIHMLPTLGISRYVGIDPAGEQIAYCKRAFPRYRFFQNEIREVGDLFPSRFDGFFSIAMLMHLPRTELDVALYSLRRAVKTGAVGLVSTPQGTKEELMLFNREFGILLTLFTEEELVGAFTRSGFAIRQLRISSRIWNIHAEAV